MLTSLLLMTARLRLVLGSRNKSTRVRIVCAGPFYATLTANASSFQNLISIYAQEWCPSLWDSCKSCVPMSHNSKMSPVIKDNAVPHPICTERVMVEALDMSLILTYSRLLELVLGNAVTSSREQKFKSLLHVSCSAM